MLQNRETDPFQPAYYSTVPFKPRGYEDEEIYNGTSDCCEAPVVNPGGLDEGICSDCREHCQVVKDD